MCTSKIRLLCIDWLIDENKSKLLSQCGPSINIYFCSNSSTTWHYFCPKNFTYMPAKHEIHRGDRKPWPQKGTGRARHGTRRSPIFMGGVKIHGPRGPISHFYMLPLIKRVLGLCSTLSVKLAQVCSSTTYSTFI